MFASCWARTSVRGARRNDHGLLAQVGREVVDESLTHMWGALLVAICLSGGASELDPGEESGRLHQVHDLKLDVDANVNTVPEGS